MFGIELSDVPVWTNVVVFIAAVIAVAVGAGWFVDGASSLGRRLGISELVLGLTVVAIGTSAPEFAVSITAAMQGQGDIAVSNVVGSNIFNLGIVLGICAIIRPIATGPKVVFRDGGFLLAGTIFAFLTIGLDLELGRVEGIFLVAGLVGYLLYLAWAGRRDKRLLTIALTPPEPEPTSIPYDIFKFAVGLALILIASRFMVDSATTVARAVGVSEWVIGVTIVAAGTSAPELATSVTAALRGKEDLGVGALVGSDIFNLFGVIGVAGLIHPVGVAQEAQLSLLSFTLMVLLVIFVMRTGWRVGRLNGALLLLVAFGRWAFDIFGAGPG